MEAFKKLLASLPPEDFPKILPEILPIIYKGDLEQYSKMVFSEVPLEAGETEFKLPSAEPSKILCNQDGYDEGVSIKCTKGKALKLDDQTPIGYNVHLPQGEVKAIFTHVYGGHEQKDRKEKMYLPGALDALDKYLLANGIAIVKLNLVDLRDLQEFQGEMPEDIHKRLHESINKYFEVFSKEPELLKDLHPDLMVLLGKPNFLFGASFGGRTSVRHAELFPKTFKGYLSFDGVLDFSTMDVTTALQGNPLIWSRQESSKWLDPINDAQKIQDPVLLLHNLDDNAVSAAVSIAFYQAAIGEKKELVKLLRLLLTERGSPIPADEKKIHYKGHFLPKDPESLKRLASYILQFMLQGPSSLPAASELTAQVHKRRGFEISTFYGGKFARLAYLALSGLFRHYYSTKQPKITEELWNSEYLPIIQSLYLVNLHFQAKTGGNESFAENLIIENKRKFSDQAFANAIARHAHGFADYLIEKYHWKVDAIVLTN